MAHASRVRKSFDLVSRPYDRNDAFAAIQRHLPFAARLEMGLNSGEENCFVIQLMWLDRRSLCDDKANLKEKHFLEVLLPFDKPLCNGIIEKIAKSSINLSSLELSYQAFQPTAHTHLMNFLSTFEILWAFGEAAHWTRTLQRLVLKSRYPAELDRMCFFAINQVGLVSYPTYLRSLEVENLDAFNSVHGQSCANLFMRRFPLLKHITIRMCSVSKNRHVPISCLLEQLDEYCENLKALEMEYLLPADNADGEDENDDTNWPSFRQWDFDWFCDMLDRLPVTKFHHKRPMPAFQANGLVQSLPEPMPAFQANGLVQSLPESSIESLEFEKLDSQGLVLLVSYVAQRDCKLEHFCMTDKTCLDQHDLDALLDAMTTDFSRQTFRLRVTDFWNRPNPFDYYLKLNQIRHCFGDGNLALGAWPWVIAKAGQLPSRKDASTSDDAHSAVFAILRERPDLLVDGC